MAERSWFGRQSQELAAFEGVAEREAARAMARAGVETPATPVHPAEYVAMLEAEERARQKRAEVELARAKHRARKVKRQKRRAQRKARRHS